MTQQATQAAPLQGRSAIVTGAGKAREETHLTDTKGEEGYSMEPSSFCFSKGLGAPVGSVLAGSAATIRRAHRGGLQCRVRLDDRGHQTLDAGLVGRAARHDVGHQGPGGLVEAQALGHVLVHPLAAIIRIASLAETGQIARQAGRGNIPFRDLPLSVADTNASLHGLVGLLAAAIAGFATTQCFCPDTVGLELAEDDTSIASAMTGALSEDQQQRILASIPAGHMGLPEEVASCVVFLASDESAYVTGQTLHVNGGMAMI